MRLLLLLLLVSLLGIGCGSSSSNDEDGDGSCPNLAGSWDIAAHCEESLIGREAAVSQNGCALSFAAPFDGFSGAVTEDAKVTLSGPQTCTGSATSNAISFSCTPGTCVVTLRR